MRKTLLAATVVFTGCKVFSHVQHPLPPLPTGNIDEPPPLHTGGPGPTEHGIQQGDPIAGGIATGIGLASMGVGVVRTINDCAQPHASIVCLRGPMPTTEADAGH